MRNTPTRTSSKSDRPRTGRRASRWHLWYFALAGLNLATLACAVGLNYSQSRSFRAAVQSHAAAADLLTHIGEARKLAIAVNAPGNDVFASRDYVRESERLDAAIREFTASMARLQALAKAELPAAQFAELERHPPRIQYVISRMLNEARQIMAFLARGDADSAGVHMAAMDREYGSLTEEISASESVVRAWQAAALAEQRRLTAVIQERRIVLAVAALLMVLAAGVHGYRLVSDMRREALDRERHTRKLARARDQAEQAARAKAQFLANMSHEIRTPMNGVLGMLDALNQTSLSPRQAGLLKTANSSADLLLAIIDDILDFSKIEAGMLVIENVPLDLPGIVQRVVSLHNVRAVEKQLSLRYELPDRVPDGLCGDPTRMTQLLSNFVSNAIKFTAQGEVVVRVMVDEDVADSAFVRCEVSDTGLGIAADVQRKLFTAFTQADNSTSRRFGGTGLGLAICKQLVHLLDPKRGEIGVRSELGAGSTFHFAIALNKRRDLVALAPSERDSQTSLTGHVLVAEDNETNQQVAITLLQHLGLKVTLAKDGREAVEWFARERFDAILMDYHMPELDGCDATAAIRALERERSLPRTPIVAVTASVLREDKERCEAAGMDDFLAKPIRKHTLAAMLGKWLSAAPQVLVAAEPRVADDSFDVEQFAEMRDISGEAFAAIVEQFHDGTRAVIAGIDVAVAAGDVESLRRLAHKLKGASATLGAKQLSAYCAVLESTAREGRLPDRFECRRTLEETYSQAARAMASPTKQEDAA